MDDLYQYTASAVNSNSNDNNEQNPTNDPLITAFTNFGWGQRFTSLIDTVKKQSEVMVDVTKKDLQEFANILRDDTNDLVDHLSQSTTSTNTITNNNETDATRSTTGTAETTSASENTDKQSMNSTDSQSTTTDRNASDTLGLYASLKEGLGKINTVNFTALRDGLSETLSKQPFLPSQLSSINLPDNINLGELRQELEEGTRFAELYLQKFGTEVIHVLNQTITVLEPEAEEDGQLQQQEEVYNQSNRGGPRIFASRTEAMVAKLQTDHEAFLTDPKATLMASHDEKQMHVLETFNTGFNIEEYTYEISRLLEGSPDLRRTMEELVPEQVDYTTFWRRYFYHTWRIDQEEQKRQMIVKGAEQEQDDDMDDFKWDSDDEDTTYHQSNTDNKKSIDKGKQKAVSSQQVTSDDTTHDTNKSDTDYSNISEPPSTEASLVSPPLKSQADGDDWVKTSTEEDRKKQPIHDDDTDSDWE